MFDGHVFFQSCKRRKLNHDLYSATAVWRQVRGVAGGSRCRRLTRRLCEGRCVERQVALGVAASQGVCVKAGAWSGRALSVSPPHKESVYKILLD